ncbi:hypothetical protein [Candidatus Amarolinea dominans]|uniref:hypothetical protein n=1 Tax=Candidatus Amarolinea dominans TaxID=3140696 RepID=UPI0031CC3D44
MPIEIELFMALEKQAHRRGVQVETLATLMVATEACRARYAVCGCLNQIIVPKI